MKIKIAISQNFGVMHIPRGFETESTGTKFRMELAEYLIENATVSELNGNYNRDKGSIQLISITDGKVLENVYYFDEAKTGLLPGQLGSLTVVEVDTEEGWVISMYGGSESVEGVPEYRRVDDYGLHDKWVG